MAGFDNDVVYGTNVDFSGAGGGQGGNATLVTNGQILIGSTALNAGGTHINVGTLTSPDGSVTFGFSSPNITATITGGATSLKTLSDDVNTFVTPNAGNIQLVGHVVEQGATKFSTIVAGSHLLNVNPMSSARWIVDPLGFNGTHTTIGAALTSATSGDTIFILPGTYTENLTLKAGVNLAAFTGDGLTPTVTIIGKATYTVAGTATISNIRLQTNSDFFLVVSGSSATILNLRNCYLNCSNNTGVSFTASNTSAAINFENCKGNLGTTGIGVFASSSTGALSFNYTEISNTGASSTANTISAGSVGLAWSQINNPITTSSTAAIAINHSNIDSSAQNVTALTHGGSGAGSRSGTSIFVSGSASGVSIGTGATLTMVQCEVSCSNSNAVTGAGTLTYTPIQFSGTGQGINTTTRNPLNFGTWIPTIVGTVAGTTTYTVQQGYYSIVGNLVYIEALISITAATGTGTAIIGSLPFTIKNLTNYDPIGTCQVASATFPLPASNTTTFFRGLPNTTTANIGTSGSGAVGNLQMANGAASFIFSCWYQI